MVQRSVRYALIGLVALVLACAPAAAAQITQQQWDADIDYFAAQAAKVHPNLFHAMTPQEWQAGLDAAKRANVQTRDAQIVAILRLVALIQDAHNEVEFPCGEGNATNYPLRLRWFPQGIVISAAPARYASIVGGTLKAIDDTPIESVSSAIAPLVSHDSGNIAGGLQAHPTIYLTCAGILHGLGITHSSDIATFVVRNHDADMRVTMHPTVSWLSVVRPITVVPPDNWIEGGSSPLPLWREHPRDMFWFKYLSEDRTLYAQINNVLDGPNETLEHFSHRLFAEMDKVKPEKFVLDLRRNSGGDNTLLRPLLVGLIRARINAPGRFLVLTSPITFSAAQNLCNRLQYYTNAIFIGQPTADNVNFYADAKPIVLPNSGIQVNISHLYWQDSDPRDRRAALYPDIAVDPAIGDFLRGDDPGLRAALTYVPEKPLEDRLRQASAMGFDAAFATYRAFVADPRHEYVHGLEQRLNTLGYQLLDEKQYPQAVVVFRINTTEHPDSANAWDSLGDGYSALGMKHDARLAYQRSLEIDPGNADAARSLKQLPL